MAKPGLKLETWILRGSFSHQEKVNYVSGALYGKNRMYRVHFRLPSGGGDIFFLTCTYGSILWTVGLGVTAHCQIFRISEWLRCSMKGNFSKWKEWLTYKNVAVFLKLCYKLILCVYDISDAFVKRGNIQRREPKRTFETFFSAGHQIAPVLEVLSGAIHVWSYWTGFQRSLPGHTGLEALPAGKTSDLTKWLVS